MLTSCLWVIHALGAIISLWAIKWRFIVIAHLWPLWYLILTMSISADTVLFMMGCLSHLLYIYFIFNIINICHDHFDKSPIPRSLLSFSFYFSTGILEQPPHLILGFIVGDVCGVLDWVKNARSSFSSRQQGRSLFGCPLTHRQVQSRICELLVALPELCIPTGKICPVQQLSQIYLYWQPIAALTCWSFYLAMATRVWNLIDMFL